MDSRLRVTFLGLRGFPGVQGGVEKHVEQLSPLLASQGCSVEVLVRSPYIPAESPTCRGEVRFVRLWAPRSQILEAITHSLLGVLYSALISRPHILHIHAIGPALVVPIATLLGLRVVVTHHGPDYDRQKWGGFAKAVLRLGEKLGMRYADARIAISTVIRDIVHRKYRVTCDVIPNGVSIPDPCYSTTVLDELGLRRGKYILLVSRMVPEKRHLDLLKAFQRLALPDCHLVFVGGSDHGTDYEAMVRSEATRVPNVVFTGVRGGRDLAELYAGAGVFVLPSSHEGLPISLLEALSYGLCVVASDIDANKAVGLSPSCYFPLGDVDELARMCRNALLCQPTKADRARRIEWVRERYDWSNVAASTFAVYRRVLVEHGVTLVGDQGAR